MKKKLAAIAFLSLLLVAAAVQIGRHSRVYPVSLPPLGRGIGSTLYLASCEPYHPYLENNRRDWLYLFQAPLERGDPDQAAEMILTNSTALAPTHMNVIYKAETFRINTSGPNAEIVSEETLHREKGSHIQKKLNALAPKTSADNPLVLAWCGGNLYGVLNERAYLLWRGKDGKKLLLSLPKIQKTGHSPCVVARGPISSADYDELPATPS